jgi:hypothetical protein
MPGGKFELSVLVAIGEQKLTVVKYVHTCVKYDFDGIKS